MTDDETKVEAMGQIKSHVWIGEALSILLTSQSGKHMGYAAGCIKLLANHTPYSENLILVIRSTATAMMQVADCAERRGHER